MSVLKIVAVVLAALLFLAAATSKLRDAEDSVTMRTHLGVPATLWKLIAVLELSGAAGILVGLAVEPLGVAAAAGLVLLSLGAVASHLRVGDSFRAAGLAVLGMVLAGAAGGLLLT
jgi:uncharacterized membrane protein YphA (DoxX/SURF4 family)